MISFLISLIILLIVFGVLLWAIDLCPFPPNIKMAMRGVLAVLLLLILLSWLIPLPMWRPHWW